MIDNTTLEEFDQSLPTFDKPTVKWFTKLLNASEDEIANVSFDT